MMYRHEPQVVEARQFDGSEVCAVELLKWCLHEGANIRPPSLRGHVAKVMNYDSLVGVMSIPKVEGHLELCTLDWLIKTEAGVFSTMTDAELEASPTLVVDEAA